MMADDSGSDCLVFVGDDLALIDERYADLYASNGEALDGIEHAVRASYANGDDDIDVRYARHGVHVTPREMLAVPLDALDDEGARLVLFGDEGPTWEDVADHIGSYSFSPIEF